MYEVLRHDDGPFPVFSATCSGDVLLEHLPAAVGDLLGHLDPVGWLTRNISAALALASAEIVSWEGEEWAVESGADDVALAWAAPGDARTPYTWLRASGAGWDQVVDTYQDDTAFGLSFMHPPPARPGTRVSRGAEASTAGGGFRRPHMNCWLVLRVGVRRAATCTALRDPETGGAATDQAG